MLVFLKGLHGQVAHHMAAPLSVCLAELRLDFNTRKACQAMALAAKPKVTSIEYQAIQSEN